MPFHENLPPTAGVPAIRAAGQIRAFPGDRPRRGPIAPDHAAREITLTPAQVRELQQLTLTGTYPDGRPIEPPEWVTTHRRYRLDVATMRALADAARSAAVTTGSSTPAQRRRQKVLTNAVEHLEHEQYETGRREATIPPPGEQDLYAGPYQPQEQAASAGEPAGPALEPLVAAAENAATGVKDVAEAHGPDQSILEADMAENDNQRQEVLFGIEEKPPRPEDLLAAEIFERILAEEELSTDGETATAEPEEATVEPTAKTEPGSDVESAQTAPAPGAPDVTPGDSNDVEPQPEEAIRSEHSTQEAGRELPLWTGPDGQAPASETDLFEAFTAVEEAWTDTVPAEAGTADDLRAALEQELRAFQEQLQGSWDRVAPAPAAATAAAAQRPPAALRGPQEAAEAVNAALRQADTHATGLRSLPEWTQLQSLRGALSNLWNKFKTTAGSWFQQLVGDARVQSWWRTVSVRACDQIARWAQAGADRLRQGAPLGFPGTPMPSAQTLLNLSDAAIAYSTPGAPDDPPPARDTNAEELRQLRGELAAGTGRAPAGLAAAANARSVSAPAPSRTSVPRGEQADHLRRTDTDQQRGHGPAL